jgi:predicted transcriptional regulator
MDKTTIQINQQTLERLKNLRKFERQSYDDVLNSMIDDIEEESLSEEEIVEIQQGLEDIRRGRVHSIESVAKELGITLRS